MSDTVNKYRNYLIHSNAHWNNISNVGSNYEGSLRLKGNLQYKTDLHYIDYLLLLLIFLIIIIVIIVIAITTNITCIITIIIIIISLIISFLH